MLADAELLMRWGANLVRQNEYDPTLYIAVPFTSWGDFHGTTLTRANYEVARNFDNATTLRSMFGGREVVFAMGEEVDDDVVERVAALYEHPYLDEEAVSLVEEELLQEALATDGSGYIIRDTVHALAKRGIEATDEEVQERILAAIRDDLLTPVFDNATEVFLPDYVILTLWD